IGVGEMAIRRTMRLCRPPAAGSFAFSRPGGSGPFCSPRPFRTSAFSMKLFERYILRRALTLFGAALAWTVAIVWTTQVLTRIDLVTDNGQSALAFFEIAALILPSVLPVVIPFALIIAV